MSAPKPDSKAFKTSTRPAVRIARIWFGFDENVSRRAYAATGLALAAFKYCVEASVLWSVNRVFFSPLDFINPVLSTREELVSGTPEWLGWAWFFWSLPFLWIAATMTVRRALNAGYSPWIGMFVLVPIVNLLVMLTLTLLPENPNPSQLTFKRNLQAKHHMRSALLGVGFGLLIAVASLAVSVYVFDTYGASLFLGTPVLMGAVASVIFNAAGPRSVAASFGIGMLTVVLAGGAFLVFALEGFICLVMAAPIALPLGGLGGVIGKIIADATVRPRAGSMALMIVLLPGWAGLESVTKPDRDFVVVTSVEIDSPIERVWDNVINFPDLPEPDKWYFRYGIACPMKADIEGVGVGAIRRCVFTTGTFVEPITAWEQPTRLAFDVESQPIPMFELSPYRHIHPPHLDHALQATRGEFILTSLENGKTRLEGRTWYQLDMFPNAYWTLWSDLLIHRIHQRVLNHVKQRSEANF